VRGHARYEPTYDDAPKFDDVTTDGTTHRGDHRP
jgi:hypothetical protein